MKQHANYDDELIVDDNLEEQVVASPIIMDHFDWWLIADKRIKERTMVSNTSAASMMMKVKEDTKLWQLAGAQNAADPLCEFEWPGLQIGLVVC